MQIEEDVSLAEFTTFHIGGLARFFCRVHTVEELKQSLAFARDKTLGTLILGGGSNMLISDDGFDGLVIKIEIAGIEIQKIESKKGQEEKIILIAGAGESWDAIVARAVEEGLWGIENLSGIPGTVGAAPVQNIGAYGSELQDTLLWVEVFDIELALVVRYTAAECAFAYRTSVFKQVSGRYVILRVALQLSTIATPRLEYKDLKEAFVGDKNPILSDVRVTVLAIRARKFPDLAQEGTAGSFFLNPVVSSYKARELALRYPDLPQYQTPEGVKLSLAWLLDHVLQLRGFSVSGARLFEKQPLVIVAARDASSRDVEELARIVIEKIQKTFGISVESEVRIVGVK